MAATAGVTPLDPRSRKRHLYAGAELELRPDLPAARGGYHPAWDNCGRRARARSPFAGQASVWRSRCRANCGRAAANEAPYSPRGRWSDAIVLIEKGAGGRGRGRDRRAGRPAPPKTKDGAAWALLLASIRDGGWSTSLVLRGPIRTLAVCRPRARTGCFPRCSRSTAVPAAPGVRFPGCSMWTPVDDGQRVIALLGLTARDRMGGRHGSEPIAGRGRLSRRRGSALARRTGPCRPGPRRSRWLWPLFGLSHAGSTTSPAGSGRPIRLRVAVWAHCVSNEARPGAANCDLGAPCGMPRLCWELVP